MLHVPTLSNYVETFVQFNRKIIGDVIFDQENYLSWWLLWRSFEKQKRKQNH